MTLTRHRVRPEIPLSPEEPSQCGKPLVGALGLAQPCSTVPAFANRGALAERWQGVVTGPTGTGKTFLACSFAERACRAGFSGHYVRASRLVHDLAVARGDGSYGRLLAKLAKINLVAIDDWLVAPLTEQQRHDLFEIIENRYERAATIIATQLPLNNWHEAIGDPTLVDAICDRLIHRAHRSEPPRPGRSDDQLRAAPCRDPQVFENPMVTVRDALSICVRNKRPN